MEDRLRLNIPAEGSAEVKKCRSSEKIRMGGTVERKA